jgi:hypothetical protein
MTQTYCFAAAILSQNKCYWRFKFYDLSTIRREISNSCNRKLVDSRHFQNLISVICTPIEVFYNLSPNTETSHFTHNENDFIDNRENNDYGSLSVARE